MTNQNLTIGRIGEDAAAELYLKHGFKILARNYYNKKGKMLGELDFVAIKNQHLHFVEIKTRTSEKFGMPEEALTKAKQARIIRAAQFFLSALPVFQKYQAHFDLVAVNLDIFDKSIKRIRIHSDAIDDLDEFN